MGNLLLGVRLSDGTDFQRFFKEFFDIIERNAKKPEQPITNKALYGYIYAAIKNANGTYTENYMRK